MIETTRGGQPPWIGALQLWALWGFGAVQPLLSVLAGNTTFFLYHRALWTDVLVVVLALCLPPLAFFWLVEWGSAKINPRVALASRLLILSALAVMLFVQPLKRSTLLGPHWVLPLALLATAALVLGYLRFHAIRRWLTLLSAAMGIFLVLFLSASQVRSLTSLGRQAARQLPSVTDKPSVVLLVFDGLPLATLFASDFGIDRELFPNFSRLADTSHWFRNASTRVTMTQLAVPSILTGNESLDPRAVTLTTYPDNLFALLDVTHHLSAFEAVTRLSPRPAPERLAGQRPKVLGPILSDLFVVYRHLITPDPWLGRVPVVEENWGGFAQLDQRPKKAVRARGAEPGDPRGQRFERFVESIARREESQFYFHHTLLPHNPSRFLPSGRRYRELVPTQGRRDLWWVDGESISPRKLLRHILQAQYADTLLGGLLDRLEAEGMLDDSVLVVTSDHGETFWPGGGTRHRLAGVDHPDDILRVPLFIKRPGQTAGLVDDRNVDLRDVTPAIADLLDIDLPWPTTGHSPFAPDFPRRDQKRLVDGHGTERVFPADFAPDVETRALVERYFPPRFGWRRLYRFGPIPDLVGRWVNELEWVEAQFSTRIDEEESLLDLDAASEFWPVRISGTLEYKEAPSEAVLALAIDGRVEATVRAKFRDGKTIFSTFVDERAIKPGRNRIEVVVIEHSGVVRRAPR